MAPKGILDWTVADVASWLKEMGMPDEARVTAGEETCLQGADGTAWGSPRLHCLPLPANQNWDSAPRLVGAGS